jgi:alkylhydroperoxidase family enzyme
VRWRRRPAAEPTLAAIERLVRTAVDGPGTLDPGTRRAAFTASAIEDGAAATYVDTVARHAYRVTDAHVEALLRSGWSEAQVLELTIAAALGAGQRRLDAGLAALGGER